jgi:hypothetical protein
MEQQESCVGRADVKQRIPEFQKNLKSEQGVAVEKSVLIGSILEKGPLKSDLSVHFSGALIT